MPLDKNALNDEHLDQVTGGTKLPYAVKVGDTLPMIAKKFNCTVEQLMRWNDLTDPDAIHLNQTLYIKF